jgi:exopolyphosphatase/pppGpp-phosphohydrolase
MKLSQVEFHHKYRSGSADSSTGYMKHTTPKNILQQVVDFGSSIRNEREHPVCVCRLACRLFDELQDLHRMGNTERIWLQAAAVLHDIGKALDGQDHNKKSRDIIISAKKLPFGKKERVIIGLVARYHRGPAPKKYHKYFRSLSKEQRSYIKKLAALLRLADGLDGNHKGAVYNLSCNISEDNIIIRPETAEQFDPIKAAKKSDLLEETLNRQVVIIQQIEPFDCDFDVESLDFSSYTDRL